ncbi:MAG: RES family NAD+ phosphorylase, partial [Bacteroidetes bacterium]|nr:RES family NAD+ phosphorylase [Bacteroidota bacterium]
INPKGIRYLYLASDKQTAIHEVKPYSNEFVTLAKFKIKKKLTIVNLCKNEKGGGNSWDNISFWFSLPLRPSNVSYEYMPIQYLASAFQEAGYDGIQYKSSLHHKGHNVVLFNPNNTKKVANVQVVVHILGIECKYNFSALK